MNKKLSLAAGIALLTLTVLLTAFYAGAIGISATDEKAPPCDVASSYAEEAILSVCKLGLMDTYTDLGGNVCFYPEESVTRAEFAYSLVRFLGIDPSKYGASPIGFYDEPAVPPSLLPYVRASLSAGVMALQSDFLFHPTDKITREEAAYLVGALCQTRIAAGKEESFSDFSETSAYFEANAKKLIDLGIMVGYNDGTFRPKQELTREELALILYRLKDDINFRKG